MDSQPSACKILTILLSITAIVLNVAMIWFAGMRRRVERGFRILLINLGIIDILFVMSVLIRVSFNGGDSDKYFLVLTRSFFKFTRWVRFLSLTWIATERVMAVWRPIKFRTVYSHFSKYKIVACLWLLPLIYTVVIGMRKGTSYSDQESRFAIYGNVSIVVALSCLNMAIPFGMSKNAMTVRSLPKQHLSVGGISAKAPRITQERKPAVLAFCVVTSFIVFSIPAIIAQLRHSTTLPVITGACNTRQSTLIVGTSFAIILDMVLDPILYFFSTHGNHLCFGKRNIRVTNVKMIAISKNTSRDENLFPKVSVSVTGDKKSAVHSQAIANKGSEIELNPPKVQAGTLLPCKVLVHAQSSEDMLGRVQEMAETKEQTNTTDFSDIKT